MDCLSQSSGTLRLKPFIFFLYAQVQALFSFPLRSGQSLSFLFFALRLKPFLPFLCAQAEAFPSFSLRSMSESLCCSRYNWNKNRKAALVVITLLAVFKGRRLTLSPPPSQRNQRKGVLFIEPPRHNQKKEKEGRANQRQKKGERIQQR